MPQSTSSVRTEDDQLIVEAPTAEEALEVVADRLGTRARIAGVERVRRGGVGGFFARELVRVTATGDDAAPRTQQDVAPEQEPDNAVDRLLRQISARDDPFAATLQRKLAPREPGDGASGNGRPLPDGPTIFVGPAAERMAGALDLAVQWPGQPTPPESFVAPISDLPTERDWLVSIRGHRHVHLIIGGPGWRGLLFDDPAVLSYTDASMCEAVTLAFQLGIGLATPVPRPVS